MSARKLYITQDPKCDDYVVTLSPSTAQFQFQYALIRSLVTLHSLGWFPVTSFAFTSLAFQLPIFLSSEQTVSLFKYVGFSIHSRHSLGQRRLCHPGWYVIFVPFDAPVFESC